MISGFTEMLLTRFARRHVQCSGRTRRNVLTAPNFFRKLSFIAAAVALLVIAGSVLLNASTTSAAPALDSEEQAFLGIINDYRAQNGLGALVVQTDLQEAADWFTDDMTSKNYYPDSVYCAQFQKGAHCDSLGRGPGQRDVAFGYPTGQYIGENLAAGFTTAQSVFIAWKASPGHNAGMLGSWKAIGISRTCKQGTYYGCYWVTPFGSYAGPGSSPGPSSTSNPTPSPTVPRTVTSTVPPTGVPTPTPTPTPDTPTPTPTQANVGTHVWDDINCDGSVTAQDAVHLLRGDVGIVSADAGCPAISDLVVVKGTYRVWGDTDCSLAVVVLDSIKLLAYLAGVSDGLPGNCPSPGSRF